MSSPIFDFTFFYSTPEIFPTAIADNDPIQHSSFLSTTEPYRTMQNCGKGNHIIPSYFTRRSIHSTVHNLHLLTLSTKRFFNRHHRMESNKGFGYGLGLRRCHAVGNTENTNDWFNTSIYSTTVSITNHRLNETFGRRNYR